MKYRNALRRFGARLGATAGAVALVPSIAFAQTADVEFDTAPVLAIVTEATVFIVAIGLAVLTMLMIAKGIKWARKAG